MMRTKKQVTEECIHYDSIYIKFKLWQKQNYTDTYTLNHKGINITTNSRLWLLLGKTENFKGTDILFIWRISEYFI